MGRPPWGHDRARGRAPTVGATAVTRRPCGQSALRRPNAHATRASAAAAGALPPRGRPPRGRPPASPPERPRGGLRRAAVAPADGGQARPAPPRGHGWGRRLHAGRKPHGGGPLGVRRDSFLLVWPPQPWEEGGRRPPRPPRASASTRFGGGDRARRSRAPVAGRARRRQGVVAGGGGGGPRGRGRLVPVGRHATWRVRQGCCCRCRVCQSDPFLPIGGGSLLVPRWRHIDARVG